MTRKMDKRLLDANAFVMGSGPGLAVLESMFNLVNAQSVLSASMVRDHELNQPLMLDALAYAMSDILDPCRPHAGRCRCTRRAVPVAFPEDMAGQTGHQATTQILGGAIPNPKPKPAPETVADFAAPGGAAPDDLVQGLKSALEQLKNTNTTTTTKTSESVQSAEEVVALLHELLEMMGSHINDLTEIMRSNYNQGLMVT